MSARGPRRKGGLDPPESDGGYGAQHGFVAGALLYLVVASVTFKGARAAAMARDTGSAEPFALLPAALALDLVVAFGGALLMYGIARVARPRVRIMTGLLALAAFGSWLAVSYTGYRLTGAPITWQTLQGAEGARLGDVDLLEQSDTLSTVLTVAVAAVGAGLLLWLGHNARCLHVLGRWRVLLASSAASLGLLAVARLWGPETYGLDEHPMLVLGASMVAGAEAGETSEALTAEDWRQLHRPLLPGGYDSALPRIHGPPPKNVIVYVAEGIPYGMTSFVEAGSTPHLYERTRRHGVLFTDFHASWHSSIQALFSIACSEHPPMDARHRTIAAVHPRIDCGELSQVLGGHGYRVGLFHGGRFSFYDKLAFLGNRGYEVMQDSERLATAYPRRPTHKWGIDDRAMVDATLKWLDGLPRNEPFAALLIPVAPHYPYWVPGDFEKPLGGRDDRSRFLDAIAYADVVFEGLAQGLEERGLYEDTLIVWVADHGNYTGAPLRPTPGKRTFYRENLHVPLVLLNPRMLPEQEGAAMRTSGRLGGHVDVLPTVLDVLGLPPDPRHRGQSLIAAAREPRRVFFGAARGSRSFVGMIEGRRKIALDLKERRMEIYDLQADPEERNDLSDDDPRLKKLYERDLMRFHRGMLRWIPERPALEDEVRPHDVVLYAARVQLQRGGQKVQCPTGERGRRECPGATGALITEELRRVGRRRSSCLMLRLPAGDVRMEIELTGKVLGSLSGLRAGVPKGVGRGAQPVRVELFVDGARRDARSIGPPSKLSDLRYPLAEEKLRIAVSAEGAGAKEVCFVLSDRALYGRTD